MGYHLNRNVKPVFTAVSKPLLTEFGIHHRLESCEFYFYKAFKLGHVRKILHFLKFTKDIVIEVANLIWISVLIN